MSAPSSVVRAATSDAVAAPSAERPSVCFITENQNFGGVEVHTLGLIGALLRHGFDVELIENRYEGYDPILEERGWRDRVQVTHTRLSGILYGEPTDVAGWRAVLKPLRSRVLIFPKGNNNFGQIRLLRLCREKFERVILIEHLEPPARPSGGKRWLGVVPGLGLWWRRRRWSSRLGAACADRVVAVSERVRSRLVEDFGYPEHKLEVVRNGVAWRDLQRDAESGRAFRERFSIPADAFVFGMLTRLSPEKGVDLALRALARVVGARPPRAPCLVVAGHGPLRAELERLAAELDVVAHVRFIGFVPRPAEVLSGYDAILFSSSLEGLPLGLLEGMAAGCVPIVTRISGMPEAVHSGDVGWVVPPGDATALGAAMLAALAMPPDALDAMRRRVSTRIREHFDVDRAHERLVALAVGTRAS
ncbi:MAG: glycosyltransferase [Proteobacteria bacterium]|nr:glycosyltransferase [Pseudomonadota bacterium]